MGQLSDEIRRLRNLKGISVRQLATSLGKTPGYISRIEVRGEIPTTELMIEIAKQLDSDPEQLFELARTDEVSEAKSAIERKYDSALSLFRKGPNVD